MLEKKTMMASFPKIVSTFKAIHSFSRIFVFSYSAIWKSTDSYNASVQTQSVSVDLLLLLVSYLGPCSPTILKNVLNLVLQTFLFLAEFDSNSHSGMAEPIRRCVTSNFRMFWRKRQRMFLRMVDEYGP